MKFLGYESYTSWIVTLGSCFINATSQTPHRIAGLLFVSIVEYYQTDRETASIPILIFIIVRCVGGPFCGILGEKFGAENITVYGSVLAAIGFGGCFFTENIIGLSICLGIVFGIGMTGSNTFLPSIVKKFFIKNINSANGIAQAGSCLGAILVPPIAVFLLDKYGLPGTFLIVSAFMLHAVPVSMIIRSASLIQDKIIAATKRNKLVHQKQLQVNFHKSFPDSEASKISTQIFGSNQKSPSESELTDISEQLSINTHKYIADSATKMHELSKLLESENEEKYTNIDDCISDSKDISTVSSKKAGILDSNSKEYTDNNIKDKDSLDESEEALLANSHNHNPSSGTSCEVNNDVDNTCKIDQLKNYAENSKTVAINSTDSNITHINKTSLLSEGKKDSIIQSDTSNDTKPTDTDNKHIIPHNFDISLENEIKLESNQSELHAPEPKKRGKYHYMKVFLNPSYLIILLSTGLHNYVTVLVWTTIIDYSRDKGIPRDEEVYFLMIPPFCEIFGRISLGWVTDLGYLTMCQYSMICFSCMALTCGCILWSTGFWMMLLGALTYAISSGAMTAVFPGMIFGYVPEELQNMAIASRYALSGPLIFTSAKLIGFFRESQGSYDGLYYLFIVMCIVCVAIMPLMAKFSSRGKKVNK